MKKLIVCIFLSIVVTNSAFAGVSVVGGLTRERTVAPGEKCENIIHLRNNEETAVQVKISKTDYLFSADGQTSYAAPGSNPRSNATWVSVSHDRITVPPKELASVYYTVDVPHSPDLNGTYWSVVMIEPEPNYGPPQVTGQPDQHTLGVQTIIRYAVQIVTNIGRTGDATVRFLDKKLIGGGKNTILQLDIENVGERSLSPFVWAELYNKDGQNIGRFDSSRLRIYPSCSVRHRLDLTGVPRGSYKALVVVDSGDEQVFGADFDLRI